MATARSSQKKKRRVRAARKRLQPIRGARGRSLAHRRLNAPRVVGLGQFAEGLSGSRHLSPTRRRAKAWVLTAAPVVIVAIWVLARVAGHL